MFFTTIITVLLTSFPTLTSLVVPIKCGDMFSRHEIRTVSAVDRARLLAEYKRQRRLLGPRQFAGAISTVKLCEIVRRIDDALAPGLTPYWDVRWDLRLPWPADSVIFSENFFPRRGRRRAKEKSPREIVPRGLTSHFRRMRINETLTSAIRSSRAAQLLIILYQLGQWRYAEDDCSSCSHRSPMAFCDHLERKCITRIMATASCNTFPYDDPCYASTCLEGVCVPQLVPLRNGKGTNSRKKLAQRAIPMITDSISSTTTPLPQDDVVYLLNITEKEQLSEFDNYDNVTLILDNSAQILASSDVIDDLNNATSQEEYAANDSSPDALFRSENSSILTTTATTTSTRTPSTSLRLDNPHFDRELSSWVYSFDDFLPYPSVYFSVTVIAGKYRPPRPRPQRSPTGVTVLSRGENLPNGYTHIVEALPLESGHVIRIPDPNAIDILVEFSFVVKKGGLDCQRLCLYRRRYVNCRRATVRLSKYPALSDHVNFYKTTRQVIDRQWKGAGYFRRRTQDAFVFTCPTGL